jgi:hypothetical protein
MEILAGCLQDYNGLDGLRIGNVEIKSCLEAGKYNYK